MPTFRSGHQGCQVGSHQASCKCPARCSLAQCQSWVHAGGAQAMGSVRRWVGGWVGCSQVWVRFQECPSEGHQMGVLSGIHPTGPQQQRSHAINTDCTHLTPFEDSYVTFGSGVQAERANLSRVLWRSTFCMDSATELAGRSVPCRWHMSTLDE